MTPSNPSFDERTVCSMSIVVELIDEFTPDRSPLGSVQVELQETGKTGVPNGGGHVRFLDLASGSYTIKVSADLYMSETLTVVADSQSQAVPIVNIPLKPKCSYPFPDRSSLVRAVVRDSAGKPIPDSIVTASITQQEETFKAKLGQSVSAGVASVRLLNIQGSLQAGDVLLIKDPTDERLEYCRIARLPSKPNADTFALSGPIQYAHDSGTLVYLVQTVGTKDTRTDERGEFALCFTRLRIHKLFTELNVQATGYPGFKQDLALLENRLATLGVISLSSK